MEAPDGVPLDLLKELVTNLVNICTDEGLLDLVYRLLAQSASLQNM